MNVPEFRPPPGLRSAHVQSMLASFKPRRWWLAAGGNAMAQAARPETFTSDDGTLEGWYSPQPDGSTGKGLCLLIHGWEGSMDSVYIYALATRLYAAGYSVLRLNLRDHGNTHHLNEAPFHACRIGEVVAAVSQACTRLPAPQQILAGFSLGGNFALRIALLADEYKLPLNQVFAISPVIDPAASMDRIIAAPAGYRRYFLRKWRRSLRAKQASWPDHYNFSEALQLTDIAELTDYFINAGYADPHRSREAYLEGYGITPAQLQALKVPVLVLAADDDPVIPTEPLRALPEHPLLERQIYPQGGHCGFITNYRYENLYEAIILAKLAQT